MVKYYTKKHMLGRVFCFFSTDFILKFGQNFPASAKATEDKKKRF